MRVAFDIGGTFTDVITVSREGRLQTAKVLSLLDRIGDDIIECVDRLGSDGVVERYIHATTICSNAVIEHKVARTGLLTTMGFRDTLELRAQKGPDRPSIDWESPVPLISRDRCLEVDERVLADGSVLRELDDEGTLRAIRSLVDDGVDAIAVCLVNSYRNPVHERRIAELVAKVAPEMVVCTSTDVHPEVREYERTSTTVINAALIPVVTRYLDRLEARLTAHAAPLLIMQSNGGMMTSKAARRRPMYMIESGPAAGALAAARLASELGNTKVLSFDMGGTTAKACLIEDGVPLERPGGEIGGGAAVGGRSRQSGYALRVPTIDLVEVGAGGGSIAWIDDGLLRVGPESASADPGPVCYRRGGSRVTVTDANVVLGTMNPIAIAGGTLVVDRHEAWRAIDALGRTLDLDVLPLAHGIVQVANAVMMRALRAVSTERGHDPREFTMVAFGGGGPLHACALADNMGITTVVVPPLPGLFSALGLLLADYRIDFVHSLTSSIVDVLSDDILAAYAAMESAAAAEMSAMGIPVEHLRFDRQLDLKYHYQVEELTLPLPEPTAGADLRDEVVAAFVAAHEREFGYTGAGVVTLVSLRLRAIAPGDRTHFADVSTEPSSTPASSTALGTRDVYFGPDDGVITVPLRLRASITGIQPGPMIIEEDDSAVVVPPGWSVRRANTSLVLSRETTRPSPAETSTDTDGPRAV